MGHVSTFKRLELCSVSLSFLSFLKFDFQFIPALCEDNDYEEEEEVGSEPAEAIEDGDTGAELDDGREQRMP